MTITIMVGLPNSGKTTKAAALSKETGAALVRLDDYYSTVIRPGVRTTADMLREVEDHALADVRAHLDRGEDVIYDAPNVTICDRRRVLDACADTGARTRCIYMNTSLPDCLSRSKSEWAAVYMLLLVAPEAGEGFDELIYSAEGRRGA